MGIAQNSATWYRPQHNWKIDQSKLYLICKQCQIEIGETVNSHLLHGRVVESRNATEAHLSEHLKSTDGVHKQCLIADEDPTQAELPQHER